MNIEWVDPRKLKENPKNRNKHSREQIERLARIIQYQGWRFPIIADKDQIIWAGHGRRLAALHLKEKTVPVCYQAFTSEEQAYAFLISDNAIAAWAELDLGGINNDLPDLGPDCNIDMLGIKSFLLEPADKFIQKELEDELIAEKFEGPANVFRVVVSVEQQDYIAEVLKLLRISNKKKYANGKVISVKWPELKNNE